MNLKKILFMMLIAIAATFGMTSVNALTISDDGKYTLLLGSDEYEPTIDGEYIKVIRFNATEGETTVKLSELTKGIVPFNGKNEFSNWETDSKNIAPEELKLSDFTKEDYYYSATGEKIDYTNGLTLSAKFEGKSLKESGKYYVVIDAFGGILNGKAVVVLENTKEDLKTIDLTKYTPVRKGYTFKGWDLDGKIVTSINSSAFAKDAAINLTATYTQDTFTGDDRVLILNANGGTIDGKASNKYDYLGGGNSGTAMSLLPYIPVREGYTFNGWNSKKDGIGDKIEYIYWRTWDKNEETDKEFEKDTLIKEESGYERYKNVTLYASWTKISGEPEQPAEETVKEIQSTGKIKGKIEFEEEVSKKYKLDIKQIEVEKDLIDKNVKYLVDINVLENGEVVKISNTKMKIRIALSEDLKGYDKYEVVYISDNEIKERIPAKIEDGYIVFETSHLSHYGVIVTNNNTEQGNEEEITNNNPKTGDNIILDVALFMISSVGIAALIYNKKKIA